MYTIKILDIIPTSDEAKCLDLDPSARCALVEDGKGHTRMLAYYPGSMMLAFASGSVPASFSAIRGDVFVRFCCHLIPSNADAGHLSGHDARTWMGYGFTLGGLVDWCDAGITEPSIAADLRRLGIDPIAQREGLQEHADSLMCDEMTVDEFRVLVFREDA